MTKITRDLRSPYLPPQLDVEVFATEGGFQVTGSITESNGGGDNSIADPDVDYIEGW